MTIGELRTNFRESFEYFYPDELMEEVPAPHKRSPRNKPITVSCGSESQLLAALVQAASEYLDEEALEECELMEDSRSVWLEALRRYMEDNIDRFRHMKVNPRVSCCEPVIGTLMVDDIWSRSGEDSLLGFHEVFAQHGRFPFFGVVAWDEDTDSDPVFLALYLNFDTEELDVYEPMQGNRFPCALEEAYAATEKMSAAAAQAKLKKYPWLNLSAYDSEDYPTVLAWVQLAGKVRHYQSWDEQVFRKAVNESDFSLAEICLEETVCKKNDVSDTDGLLYYGFSAMAEEMSSNITIK